MYTPPTTQGTFKLGHETKGGGIPIDALGSVFTFAKKTKYSRIGMHFHIIV